MSNTISGNTGVANASVTLEGKTATTGRVYVNGAADASGNYSFAGLAPGTYTLRAAAPGFGFNQVCAVIALANPQDQSNVNLTPVAIAAGPTAGDLIRSPNGR
jgi:hypothetical protein